MLNVELNVEMEPVEVQQVPLACGLKYLSLSASRREQDYLGETETETEREFGARHRRRG